MKSLNLVLRGFVSLTRIVGLQAKVVCKNSRRRKGGFAHENLSLSGEEEGETTVFTGNAKVYKSFISDNGKLTWRAMRGSLIGRN